MRWSQTLIPTMKETPEGAEIPSHVLMLRSGLITQLMAGAYTYLPASVGTFPPPGEFMTILRQSGFAEVQAVPLTFGIVYLYTGRKP